MGLFRFFLALIVMMAHATPPGWSHDIARVSVLTFYVISGYGCTRAIMGKYKGRKWEFLVSRYLRIWPGYIFVFGISSLAWYIWPELPTLSFPLGVVWVKELFMVNPYAMLVPTGWMIRWLLLGYLVISLGISETPRRTLLWLIISFSVSQHQVMSGWGYYYTGVGAWSLAYSIGSAIAWMPIDIPVAKGWALDLTFPLFLCHSLVLDILRWYGWDLGWHLFFVALPPSLTLSCLVVIAVERPIARYRYRLKTQQ